MALKMVLRKDCPFCDVNFTYGIEHIFSDNDDRLKVECPICKRFIDMNQKDIKGCLLFYVKNKKGGR